MTCVGDGLSDLVGCRGSGVGEVEGVPAMPWRERLEGRPSSLLKGFPADRMQRKVAVGDQDLIRVLVVTSHDDGMPTEVVLLREVEVGKESHVEIHEHRLVLSKHRS